MCGQVTVTGINERIMFLKIQNNDDYIGKFDNALNERECDLLLDLYQKSPKIPSGYVHLDGQKVQDPDIKRGEELKDMRFSHKDRISNLLFPSLNDCIKKYYKKYPGLDIIASWKYDDEYTFKKFESEEDGYKKWHTEHGPGDRSNRILAWMYYLNDAKSGTEFLHYPTVKAKRGRCIIWPASWTHIHRSAPNKGIKYIVSGWISHI